MTTGLIKGVFVTVHLYQTAPALARSFDGYEFLLAQLILQSSHSRQRAPGRTKRGYDVARSARR